MNNANRTPPDDDGLYLVVPLDEFGEPRWWLAKTVAGLGEARRTPGLKSIYRLHLVEQTPYLDYIRAVHGRTGRGGEGQAAARGTAGGVPQAAGKAGQEVDR